MKGLILADTRADAENEEGKKYRDAMIEFAMQSCGESIADKMLPKLLAVSTRQDKPEIVAQVRAISAINSGAPLADLVAAMRDRRDSTGILGGIAVPTLVLGGRNDAVSSPEVMGAMAAKIPGAKHVVLEDAGHLANLEQPQAFNAALKDFLDTLL